MPNLLIYPYFITHPIPFYNYSIKKLKITKFVTTLTPHPNKNNNFLPHSYPFITFFRFRIYAYTYHWANILIIYTYQNTLTFTYTLTDYTHSFIIHPPEHAQHTLGLNFHSIQLRTYKEIPFSIYITDSNFHLFTAHTSHIHRLTIYRDIYTITQV